MEKVIGGIILLWIVLWFCRQFWFALQGMSSLHSGRAERVNSTNFSDRSELWENLPRIALVPGFSRAHGRIPKSELADDTGASLLAHFEAKVLNVADPRRMFFAAHKRGSEAASFVIGYHMGWFTTLRSMVVIEQRGDTIEFNLFFAEVRFFRTPPEVKSHFLFSPEREAAKYSGVENTTGAAMSLWDLCFSNVCTNEGLRHVEYFERFIKECFSEALEAQRHRQVNRLSTPAASPAFVPQSAAASPMPVQRPTRRI